MKIRQGTALTCETTEMGEMMMERKDEYKSLTHEELVAEAIALIQQMEYNQIKKALEAALEVK